MRRLRFTPIQDAWKKYFVYPDLAIWKADGIKSSKNPWSMQTACVLLNRCGRETHVFSRTRRSVFVCFIFI